MPALSTLRNIPPNENSDLPVSTRIELALNEWKAAKGTLSVNKAAHRYGLYISTLRKRILGGRSRKEYDEARQKLTVQEELSLKGWILYLIEGGFPLLVN
ncbi:hypothetical protein L207DRAFT_23663 [Hyaloscypha variabilis F]|uniref:HTH psq-type domain-containing protein n=1 Tax=Hyaloscypha variabilis (strain UAMH 11265 / GT02V1 / F) TaxID=1149755 RepID=A0A2J6RM16_HYAVF|nr:hypothetical protein L207DRAFT_23663 [Hyaloscypha variabilis F]